MLGLVSRRTAFIILTVLCFGCRILWHYSAYLVCYIFFIGVLHWSTDTSMQWYVILNATACTCSCLYPSSMCQVCVHVVMATRNGIRPGFPCRIFSPSVAVGASSRLLFVSRSIRLPSQWRICSHAFIKQRCLCRQRCCSTTSRPSTNPSETTCTSGHAFIDSQSDCRSRVGKCRGHSLVSERMR